MALFTILVYLVVPENPAMTMLLRQLNPVMTNFVLKVNYLINIQI